MYALSKRNFSITIGTPLTYAHKRIGPPKEQTFKEF